MIRKAFLCGFLAAWCVGSLSSISSASIIAHWTFETSLPTGTGSSNGPYSPEFGTGEARGFHASSSTTWSNPVGNGSAESWSSNNWAIGDYYQFKVNLTGFESATVRWAQTRSSNGPSGFKIQVSTDGTTFSDIHSYTVNEVGWSSGSSNSASNFAAISLGALTDNQTSVYVRMTATSAAGGTTGSNRVDDVIIEANMITNVIPEPGSMAMFGMVAGLSLVWSCQRRRLG